MSHTGEFSPHCFPAVEFIAMEAYSAARKPPRRDGIPPGRVSAGVRTRIKDHLAANMAVGYGNMLLAAGEPATFGNF